MPVYRKGRRSVESQNMIVRKAKPGTSFEKREFVKPRAWTYDQSTLEDVESRLKYNLRKQVKSLCQNFKNPIIVDWGCGKGTALWHLSALFPNAKYFGLSDIRYIEWNKKEAINFIQAVEQDFSRYFKDGTIDLLYSNWGLENLPPQQTKKIINKLVPKLKIGGKIVAHYSIVYYLLKGTEYYDGTTFLSQKFKKNRKTSFENFDIIYENDSCISIIRTK
ncbi:MAG: class I SAM-dependent methyltransferase [archaeon]|nr:class I SAM-dependent methyltransferase [archaeon]